MMMPGDYSMRWRVFYRKVHNGTVCRLPGQGGEEEAAADDFEKSYPYVSSVPILSAAWYWCDDERMSE